MQKGNKLYLGDCLNVLPEIETDSIDAIVTDPPYGISFMGKDWDKAVPSIAIWQECVRVLKPGAFAFVMCIPRQDCLARMICRLEDAGFNIAFSSIYHTFGTGFPKSQNIAKAADTRAGVKREVIGKKRKARAKGQKSALPTLGAKTEYIDIDITKSATPQAKALEGAYAGMQLKPAVEIVIVAMKPLSEKRYIDQAISNNHGCTWLDDCRIPFESDDWNAAKKKNDSFSNAKAGGCFNSNNILKGAITQKGRFPANVLCEDNVLNDGNTRKSGNGIKNSIRDDYYSNTFQINRSYSAPSNGGDTGSFSRYFSLDAWFAERIKQLPKEAQKTFPWLIVPKASKSEKNRGLEGTEEKQIERIQQLPDGFISSYGNIRNKPAPQHNFHATVKPIKLMSWLITLASREGDIILDPFCGSGTTLIAAKMLGRQYIGIELEKEYYDIARLRIDEAQQNIDKFS